jgi:ubiquinone/menaquinone biosynthesis C-methylase UbiE
LAHDRSAQSEEYLQHGAIHSQWQSDYLNPDLNHFYDLVFADIIKRLQPKPDDRLLDAGCGYGYHTVRLARGNVHITAIDFSDAALKIARQTIAEAGIGGQVTLEKADLTHLPFASDSFDFVVSWGVIMHIPEMEKALLELNRVLKPGGMLVLYENNMHSLDVAFRERAIRFVKNLLGREQPAISRTPRGLESWTQSDDGGLMVRKTDVDFLTRFLTQKGIFPIASTAGQFTEAYTNMPTRFLKRLVYKLNIFYFKRIRNPKLAMGNLVYFRKSNG